MPSRSTSADSRAKPIIWSIAGNDSAGGAGLSADQRAAQAFGVHLCPVVAAVTAQSSTGVTRVEPVSVDLLDAQLAALADDLPPRVIKTGLLGSAAHVAAVARWVDRLRERAPVALVVDPVLRSSTGASFAADEVLQAYVHELLPRATLATPNEAEARRLLAALGQPSASVESAVATTMPVPSLAQALRSTGVGALAITGGDSTAQGAVALDWLDTDHARGWLSLPRMDTPHTHGTGCTFATSAAAALALGFVPADALVLAKMATAQALRHGYAAGQGAGPVAAMGGFATDPSLMPMLTWGDRYDIHSDMHGAAGASGQQAWHGDDLGLYAIVDSAERVREVVSAGVRTVQLRIKTPPAPDAAWHAALRASIEQSLAACAPAGATLVVNDHWRLAAELAPAHPGSLAVHLGQEDLLALGDSGRAELAVTGLPLGISSHSLWELARARAWQPWYVACGPVWPTLTKAMPWAPQGLDNLAWWVHMAGVPVVAIGGILDMAQATAAARSGASGVCVVRGLGDAPARTVPLWQAALDAGRAAPRLPLPAYPHPSLVA